MVGEVECFSFFFVLVIVLVVGVAVVVIGTVAVRVLVVIVIITKELWVLSVETGLESVDTDILSEVAYPVLWIFWYAGVIVERSIVVGVE